MTYDHIQNISQIISYCAVFYLVSQIKNPTFATYLFVIPISFISTYLYLTFPEDIDPIYGFYLPATYVFNIALGYFLYENILNFSTQSLISEKLHGIAAFMVYSLGYITNLFSKYAIFYLTYEISTIFLNKAQTSNNLVYKILFVLTFFVFRIILGTFVSYDFVSRVYDELSSYFENKIILYYVFCVMIMLCIFFVGLNYFWFYKIMKKVQKLMAKQSDKSE